MPSRSRHTSSASPGGDSVNTGAQTTITPVSINIIDTPVASISNNNSCSNSSNSTTSVGIDSISDSGNDGMVSMAVSDG